ncbi:MAG: tetratricopeptide repeat protein, partial [Candidatus Omnitrophica bacterium]|nr:tetratricopeptide repeat protein [Candidatus Omnitrophota bacterium]
MKKYVFGIFIAFLLISSASPHLLAQDNLEQMFIFPDAHQPNNTEEVFSRFSGRPWTSEEKKTILDIARKIQQYSPGFVARLTAYRPVNLYRIGESPIDAWSVPSENALVVSDGAFKRGPEFVIGHEFTHLLDSTKKLSNHKEWLTIILPIIKKIETTLQKEGMSVVEAVWVKRVNREKVAHEEGLPTLYAAVDSGEALGESVAQSMFGDNPSLSSAIKEFLQLNVFSPNFKFNEADRHFHQGLSLFVQLKLYEAIKEFDSAVKIEPNFAWAYVRRADVQAALGHDDQAIEDYSRAIELVESTDLGRICLKRAELLVKAKKWEKAVADYNAAIEQIPNLVTSYLERGKVHSELKEHEKAIADFSIYIKRNPDNPAAYVARGK